MTSTTVRKSYGNRKLNTFPEDYVRIRQKINSTNPKKSEDVAKLIKYIDDNVIGKNNAFVGPFGRRKGELQNHNEWERCVLANSLSDLFRVRTRGRA